MVNKNKGRVYLVPTPLVEGQVDSLPEYNRSIVSACRYFLVESLKLGRRHIRAMVPGFDLDNADLKVLNKHTSIHTLEDLLKPALDGNSICVLSDAGCPGIADPGSAIVRVAHLKSIDVIALSGPSAILIALMASGFNGQQFHFHGYLSRDKNKLRNELKQLSQQAKNGTTQIFMETPYRNLALLQSLITILTDNFQLCLACNLTAKDQLIQTQSIAHWKKSALPNIHKRPCIFLLSAAG